MGKVLLIALFVFLNFLSIWALPSGPPPAACRNLNPQGHVGSSQNLGFQLVARDGTTFAPGGPSIVVSLIGTRPYRGIFLQVRNGPDLDSTTTVGTWTESITPGFFGIVDCSRFGFSPNSALSHTSRESKRAAQGFRWTPPDDCNDGQIFIVRATVVSSFSSFQTGLQLPLTCSKLSGTTSTTELPFSTLILTTPTPTIFSTPPPSTAPPTPPPSSLPPLPTGPTTVPTVATTDSTKTDSSSTTPPLRGCQFSNLNSIPDDYTNSMENSSNVFRGWESISIPSNSSYKWTRRIGPTPTLGTGPSEAYDGDAYVYAESGEPASEGEQAILLTRQDLRGCFCFRFAYSFDITGEGHTLSVVMGNFLLGTLRERSPEWTNTAIPVDTPAFVQIQIIGTRGKNWLGDIGLDNIKIEPGTC